jgi:purine nucleosidase/ribosylpyrimidine nucleosidase
MTGRRVALDCDAGTDDAVAIVLAALHPGLDLVGVTSVWGNVAVEHTTDNALRVLDLVGRTDVPVLHGSAGPLRAAPDAAARARHLPPHLPLPPTQRTASGDAVEWLVETLSATTAPVTLVPTGPLTNIARALAARPSIVDAVEEVVLMGGSHARANVTPSAERNAWWDAEAAHAVLTAGFRRLVMITLDATSQALATADDCDRWRRLGTPVAAAVAVLVEERLRQYGGPAPVHDPLTVAYLVDPAVVELRHLQVAVETTGLLTYGRTVIDVVGVDGLPPNAHVALEVDAGRYLDLITSVLG